jgi:HEAT repeat protein
MTTNRLEEFNKQNNILKRKLFEVGLNINGISDLVNTNKSYPEALDILLEFLVTNEIYDIDIKEGIVRALTVKEMRGKDITPLIEEYIKYTEAPPAPIYYNTSVDDMLRLIREHKQKYPNDLAGYRWAIGNAIGYTMTKRDIPAIIELVKNRENWKSRNMMVSEGLGKRLKAKEAEDVLISLLDDFWLCGSIIVALGYMGSKKAVEKIKPFLDNENPNLRKEAKKALERIKKASEK